MFVLFIAIAMLNMVIINSHTVSAFIPPSKYQQPIATTFSSPINFSPPPIISTNRQHISTISNRRTAITTTRLQSFFGLGPGELILIAIAGLLVVGPTKLLRLSKEAGEVAGKTASGLGDEWDEIKSIPEEFQKGVEEGEIEARSRKAKVMDKIGDDDSESSSKE